MSDDRRRFFRIEDYAFVSYRVIAPDDLEEQRRLVVEDEARPTNLQATLLGIELRLQDAIDAVRTADKVVASALELMNRKIALLERVVSLESVREEGGQISRQEPVKVNLSGGGMGMPAQSSLDIGTHLAVEVSLLPSNDTIRAVGKVVICRESADSPCQYAIAIEFVEILERDRDTLVKHIVRKQSASLRAERQSSD